MKINPNNYTKVIHGDQVRIATIRDGRGMEAVVCSHGARLIGLSVPDGRGGSRQVLLGYDDLDGYLGGHVEMGALAGRVCNRIGHARFELDGRIHRLAANDGANHLHGGLGGTMRRLFGLYQDREDEVLLRARLADGEDGYPGNLDLEVVFALPGDGRLRMVLAAGTDSPTPVSLCNHAYFNLSDDPTILDHVLEIKAGSYTPVGAALIPLGTVEPVAGTPLDFRTPARIGDRIEADFEQIRHGGGYDHNFVLDSSQVPDQYGERLAARLRAPSSDLVMEVRTTEPGLQFYSGNMMGGPGPAGRRPLIRRSGLCLETQGFPDAVNRPRFPSVILRPGQRFASSTSLVFEVRP